MLWHLPSFLFTEGRGRRYEFGDSPAEIRSGSRELLRQESAGESSKPRRRNSLRLLPGFLHRCDIGHEDAPAVCSNDQLVIAWMHH